MREELTLHECAAMPPQAATELLGLSKLPVSRTAGGWGPLGDFYKQPKTYFQKLLEHLRLEILLKADGC